MHFIKKCCSLIVEESHNLVDIGFIRILSDRHNIKNRHLCHLNRKSFCLPKYLFNIMPNLL